MKSLITDKFMNDETVRHNIVAGFTHSLLIGYELMIKEGLLTPHLVDNFGAIEVEEISDIEQIETTKTYIRRSIIKQRETNIPLLEAQLRIIKDEVPQGLINDLKNTDNAFGCLLNRYGVKVISKKKRLILQEDLENHKIRIGRNHLLVSESTNKTICYVQEIMSFEEVLVRAKELYLKI